MLHWCVEFAGIFLSIYASPVSFSFVRDENWGQTKDHNSTVYIFYLLDLISLNFACYICLGVIKLHLLSEFSRIVCHVLRCGKTLIGLIAEKCLCCLCQLVFCFLIRRQDGFLGWESYSSFPLWESNFPPLEFFSFRSMAEIFLFYFFFLVFPCLPFLYQTNPIYHRLIFLATDGRKEIEKGRETGWGRSGHRRKRRGKRERRKRKIRKNNKPLI